MSDILFAYDRLVDGDAYTSHGVEIEGGHLSDPIENCIDFVFKRENWPLCDCGNFFLGMFQNIKNDYLEKSKREWDFLPFEYRLIDKITNEKYYYLVNLKEWSAAIGCVRHTDIEVEETIFDYINSRVLNDCKSGQAKILFNYGYEGFGKLTNGGDTILYPKLLNKLHLLCEKHDVPQESIVYVDSNVRLNEIELNTKVDFWGYEYCALDQHRYTTMHKDLTYHGSKRSKENYDLWDNGRNTYREKYYLSLNRLPKPHRIKLLCNLIKHDLLNKGFVSSPKHGDFFEWYVDENLKNEGKKLKEISPLSVDGVDFTERKWSYEKFDVKYYLQSYFSIVAENQYTGYKDQLQNSEKIWKPITNFQPFINVGDYNQLKNLQSQGFKTFHPYIDESYDDIMDLNKRFEVIIKEIVRLCSMSKEEIHEWYWNMEEILKYNYYHFHGKFASNYKKWMLSKLEGHSGTL